MAQKIRTRIHADNDTNSPTLTKNNSGKVQQISPVHASIDTLPALEASHNSLQMQRLLASHAIQAKLRVGRPGDMYEMEADRIAEQVMRMPDLVCPTCVKDALQYQSTNTGIPVQLPYFLQKFRLDIRSFFWDSFIALSNLVVFFESFAGPAGRKGSDINVPGSMEIIVQTGTRRL